MVELDSLFGLELHCLFMPGDSWWAAVLQIERPSVDARIRMYTLHAAHAINRVGIARRERCAPSPALPYWVTCQYTAPQFLARLAPL